MREGRYGVGSRRRSRSPQRPLSRSRDFNDSRHRKYSPYHGGTEEYSREAGISRGIEKRDCIDKRFNLRGVRFSGYDSRDRDRLVVGARRSSNPPRTEKRDNFDRDEIMRAVRSPCYDEGDRGKYKNGASIGSSRKSYDDDSYHRDLSSVKFQSDHLLDGSRHSGHGAGAGSPRKSYDDDSYCHDLSSLKFQSDRLLDGLRKYDHLNVTDYRHMPDNYGVGNTGTTRRDDERDCYQHSRYADSSQPGLLSPSPYLDNTKSVCLEYEGGRRMHSCSYSLVHSGFDDMPRSNLNGGDGSSLMSSVTSKYLNSDTDKQGFSHFWDELHLEKRDGAYCDQDFYFEKKSGGLHFQDELLGVDKTDGREICKLRKEDSLLSSQGYLKRDSDYAIPSSQPRDYVSLLSDNLREGFPGCSSIREIRMPSHEIQLGYGLTSEPIPFDGYGEEKQIVPPRGPGDRRLCLGLTKQKQGDQLYAEFGRSKIKSTCPNDVEEQYTDQHVRKIDVLNPTINESFHSTYTRNDELREHYPFSKVWATRDKFDDCGPLLARKKDIDVLGTKSSHLNYGTEGCHQYDSVRSEEQHPEAGGGLWSNGERFDVLQRQWYDPSLGRLYDNPRKRFAVSDFSLVEPSARRLKQVNDDILYGHGVGIKISTDGNGSRMIYNQVGEGDGIDVVNFSKKPDYDRTWSASAEMVNYKPSSSKFSPSHSVRPSKSGSRDIKKRLGPVPHKLHVSQRLAKKYKSSIKKRLGPAPPKKRATLPWLKNISSNIKASVHNGSDEIPCDQDGDHLGDHHPLAKPEPPERSKDFKQMVRSAFYKFLKEINETPTKRKKYMEQGKAGSLKCIVCGSNSEEFIETESLVIHAFTSEKFGLRSQHLGLHRALCVMMGWKIPEEMSSEWHCEVMTDAETSAFKEDLVIWPPVVIVHNCTIDSKNPEERVIVTIEKMGMKLKDMGFGSILKVCLGKPANQSVMLVKFNGTLSGLREAQRFHRSYVESKHGRAELSQFNNGGSGRQTISADREENFLYGYLGLAEDLDKLDFDTKKRCVLRSKKEILSIANA